MANANEGVLCVNTVQPADRGGAATLWNDLRQLKDAAGHKKKGRKIANFPGDGLLLFFPKRPSAQMMRGQRTTTQQKGKLWPPSVNFKMAFVFVSAGRKKKSEETLQRSFMVLIRALRQNTSC